MSQLQKLTSFNNLFDNVKERLNNYNDNLQNELFEIEPNESNEEAYKRGEILFDQCEEDIRNLTEIIEHERNIIEFFEKCKENKTKLIEQKNELINKLLRIKKNSVSKEEYLNLREFWNTHREETEVERMKRETKEMLEIVTEKEKYIEEITIKMNEKEKQLNELIEKSKIIEIKNELNGKINEVENTLNTLQNRHNQLNENVTNISHQQNEILNNYVKKNDKNKNEIEHHINSPTDDKNKNFTNYEEMTNYDELYETINTIKTEYVSKNELTPLIISNKTNLTPNQIMQLEEWTSLKCCEIVFDSIVDNWNVNTSVFNERVFGKKQLAFIIEDLDGEIFGYYLNTRIIDRHENISNDPIPTDWKSFHFNLQSKNNRLSQPMKFDIKNPKCGHTLYETSNQTGLVWIGQIVLCKENNRQESLCLQLDDKDGNNNFFDFNGINNALCGKSFMTPNDEKGSCFIPKRIIVIQMK